MARQSRDQLFGERGRDNGRERACELGERFSLSDVGGRLDGQ